MNWKFLTIMCLRCLPSQKQVVLFVYESIMHRNKMDVMNFWMVVLYLRWENFNIKQQFINWKNWLLHFFFLWNWMNGMPYFEWKKKELMSNRFLPFKRYELLFSMYHHQCCKFISMISIMISSFCSTSAEHKMNYNN